MQQEYLRYNYFNSLLYNAEHATVAINLLFRSSLKVFQHQLDLFIPLLHRLLEPILCCLCIMCNTFAVMIRNTQQQLRACMSLLCSLAVPLDSLDMTLGSPLATAVHHTYIELCLCIVLFGSFETPCKILRLCSGGYLHLGNTIH